MPLAISRESCVLTQRSRTAQHPSLDAMPVRYDRDDLRRLITVTVSDPYTTADIITVIDRQVAENTWDYALFYDLRSVLAKTDLKQGPLLAAHLESVAAGRRRGPVGIAINPDTDRFLASLQYARTVAELAEIEVLVTAPQVASWLTRHVHESGRAM